MRLRTIFVALGLAVVGIGLVARQALGFDRLYDRTPVGTIEVKELPARKALAASASGSYFQRDNQLFMTLFDFIKTHDIAMTVPVEAEVDSAQMRFFVGADNSKSDVTSSEAVAVTEMPSQTVLSIGIRGAYSDPSFQRGRKALEQWLNGNTEWRAVAEPYAVYWDGPYMPVPFRRSEVHIRIVRALL